MLQQIIDQLSKVTNEEQQILDGGRLEKEIYTQSGGFRIDSERLMQLGKLISLRPHTRFVDFPDHSHNYVELIYMASGTTTHTINKNHTIQLGTGELLFLNHHVTHSIRRSEAQDIAINFIVLPPFFDIAFEMIGPDNVLGSFLVGCLQRDASDVSYLHFKVADILPVQNLIENMVWGILNEQPNNRKISQICMGLLFLQLLNCTQRLEMPKEGQGNNALVVAALREIEENYRYANFSEFARRYHVSLAYVSRLVKQSTGKNFKQLLMQKRMAKAVQMLLATHLSVTEIIEAVGYENTSYFHAIFKKEFGTTPKQYRQSARQQLE